MVCEKHGWGNNVKLYFTHISDNFVCSLCFKFQVKILLCSEVLAISFFQKKLMVCGGDAYFKQVKNGDLKKCTLYIFVKSQSRELRNILQNFIIIQRRGPPLRRRKFWTKKASPKRHLISRSIYCSGWLRHYRNTYMRCIVVHASPLFRTLCDIIPKTISKPHWLQEHGFGLFSVNFENQVLFCTSIIPFRIILVPSKF